MTSAIEKVYHKYVVKKIKLTRGFETIVDDEDFDKFSIYKWHALVQKKVHTAKVYACRARYTNGRKGKKFYLRLHREILDAPFNLQVDHINGNTLDNRKSNLRVVTNQQNQFNTSSKNNKTGYKGVSYMPWVRGRKHYYASITLNNKKHSCGYYRTARQAAIAYNKKATELFGEYARLNKL